MIQRVFFLFLGISLLLPTWLQAEEFYRGQTISLISYSKPGDSYDSWARLLARHMPRYIAGNPNIIVENMPGAGGLVALNEVYNRVAPDGLTLLLPPRHFAIPQLVGEKSAKYDAAKFTYIGSADKVPFILGIRASYAVKSMSDLRRAAHPVPCSATGKGATSYDFLALLRWAGFKVKIIGGYAGKGEQILALEKGEVDCVPGSYSGNFAHLVDRQEVRPIVQMGENIFPKVPDILAVEMSPEAKQVFRVFSTPLLAARPVVGPPSIPTERLKILRQAFNQAIHDPELAKEAKKQKLKPGPLSGEEVSKIEREILSQPPGVVKAYKTALGIK
jgi:tripartite-type tricarboxylate transporter receptor subunit TctC